jgi:hypothetical protein
MNEANRTILEVWPGATHAPRHPLFTHSGPTGIG